MELSNLGRSSLRKLQKEGFQVTSFLLLVGVTTVLIGLGLSILLLMSYFLGRPLSKGCGKTDCCRNKKKLDSSQKK